MPPSSTLPINQNICKSPSGHSVIMLCAKLLIPEQSYALCYNGWGFFQCARSRSWASHVSSLLGMILLFWFLGWLWVQCYLTDRFSTACENFSIWGSQQSNIELATYILTHTHYTQITRKARRLPVSAGCLDVANEIISPHTERNLSFSLSLFLTFLLPPNRTELKAHLAGIVSLECLGLNGEEAAGLSYLRETSALYVIQSSRWN